MPHALSRRTFLGRSAAVAASAALLPLLRATPSLAAAPAADLEDLIDAGDSFARGAAKGASVSGGAVRATTDGGTFTSGPLRAAGRFTHVGLHWTAVVPERASLELELRTSPDGTNWSPWQELHVERQPGETPVGDYFASLVTARGAQHVQYRATFRTPGGASPTLQRVTATTIDAPVTATTTDANKRTDTVAVPDTDSGLSLAVLARESWLAPGTDSYRFNKRGQEIWPEMFVPAKKLVVHHTATSNGYQTAAEAQSEVQAIYKYHAVTQRWGDIGYNALVDKFGNIYEGRHGRGEGDGRTGGREVLSAGVVAGHDYAHNYGSAGVALLGWADSTKGWEFTAAMQQALRDHSLFESGRHFLRPLKEDGATAESSEFLRSDDAWASGMKNVSGHQETNATECPGLVMGHLATLRGQIREGLATRSQARIPLSPTGTDASAPKESTTGTPLSYTWQAPAGGWGDSRVLEGYEYCIEGWYKPSDSYDVQYISGYTDETQPRQRWRRADSTASDTFLGESVTPNTDGSVTVAFTPTKAGHYTLHVRAVFADDTRTAYESNHTYLVKAPSSTGGGKKPRG